MEVNKAKKDLEDTEEEEEEEDEEEEEVLEGGDEEEKDEIEQIIKEKEDEIESVLECKAKKLNMNRTQVRTLLRQILGSKEVIHHSLEVAGDKISQKGDESDAVYACSSRMTRMTAKSLTEVGGKLDWVLETIKSSQACKVSVNEDDTLVLVTQELPDDDKPEDDPEYHPESEMELEGEDELDDCCATPCSSIAQNTPSSKRSLLESSPSESPRRGRADSEEEEQRRLTRSKASLKEVSIEELEKKFIPPDITSDMYSTEMDEYAMFLQETFGYQEPVLTNASAVQEEDPDFIYQDNEETADNQYEFKFDRSTKIPRKEVDDLISELLAEYEDSKKEEKKPPKEIKITAVEGRSDEKPGTSSLSSSVKALEPLEQTHVVVGYSEISDEIIQRISQQMRQHIQLLLQMALLTSNDSQWSILNRECKTMFKEIMNRSLSKKFSLYAQDNLFPSMNFLQEWEESGKAPSLQQSDAKSKNKFKFSKELIEAIGESECILYPYLLPTSSLKSNNDKSYFSEGEDFLIVYGLDKYQGNSRKEVLRLISIHSMTPKTLEQIRWRIKNATSKFSSSIITSYVRDGTIPSFPDPLIPYKPSDIVKPKYCSTGELPEPWCQALNVPYDHHRASKHPMLVKDPQIPSTSKVKPIAKQITTPVESRELLESKVDPMHVRLIVPKPSSVPITLQSHSLHPTPQPIGSSSTNGLSETKVPMEPLNKPPSKAPPYFAAPFTEDEAIEKAGLPDFETEENTAEDHSLQEAEAGDIFLCVQEMLPPETRNLFFEKIVKLTSEKTRAKPAEIFTELHSICEGFSDLQERLLDLLNPQDAMSLGPDIYFQFKVRNFAKKFLKKISLLYKNEPASMEAVVSGLQDIVGANPSTLRPQDIQARAQSMFKSDPSLCTEFLSFLPNVILNDQALKSVEREVDVISDKGPLEFEKASLPKLTNIDQGSERCVCNCHSNEDGEKNVHCVHCSLRFVNGQVYRKDGKMTRSLQVRYKVAKDAKESGTTEVPRKKRKNIS